MQGAGISTCLSYYNPSSTRTLDIFSVSSSSTVSRSIGTYAGGGGFAIASVVQVRFQVTDLAVLSPFDKTATITATVTATAKAEGLSTGAKSGIGVGVPIFILLLVAIGIGLLLLRRWKTRSNPGYQMDNVKELPLSQQREIDGMPVAVSSQTYEMDGREGRV